MVEAQFLAYLMPPYVGPEYPISSEYRMSAKSDSIGIGNFSGTSFSIGFIWDGGSVENIELRTTGDYRNGPSTYFVGNNLRLLADVPSIVADLRFNASTSGGIRLVSSANSGTIWGKDAMEKEYRRLISDHLMPPLNEFSNDTARYIESKRAFGRFGLSIEFEVHNLSRQSDIGGGGVQAYTYFPIFLNADGTVIRDADYLRDSSDGVNPNFDFGSRDVLAPGLSSIGKLNFIIPALGPRIEYIVMNLKLPTNQTGWRIIPRD